MSQNQDRMTVRERERVQRARILDSPEFDKWYEARRQIQPSPSDPYRAFMIDRSLRAKPYDEASWMDYVNRSDLEPIDNVHRGEESMPDEGPVIHRRHRQQTFIPSTRRRLESHVGEPLYQDVQALKEDFINTYHLTDVDIIVEKRSRSAYSPPLVGLKKPQLLIPEHHYQAVKKEGHKKYIKKQWDVINSHELGHHAQYAYGNYQPQGKDLEEMFKSTEGQPTRTIREEKFAWTVARDYYAKKGKKWKGSTAMAERWAFGTYTDFTPEIMKGPGAKVVMDRSKQLLVSAKRAKTAI